MSASATDDRSALVVIGGVSLAVVLVVGYLLLGHTREPEADALAATLPLLNACLNATSAALLSTGWVFIRRRRVTAHKTCMVSALVVSTLFLVSYVTYHSIAGSRPFVGAGWIRLIYYPMLLSHIVLAAAIVPLALTTVYRALQGNFARHVRIARWTLPIWLYVSVTGVLVYWMLYRL
jgi:putative membrane protein